MLMNDNDTNSNPSDDYSQNSQAGNTNLGGESIHNQNSENMNELAREAPGNEDMPAQASQEDQNSYNQNPEIENQSNQYNSSFSQNTDLPNPTEETHGNFSDNGYIDQTNNDFSSSTESMNQNSATFEHNEYTEDPATQTTPNDSQNNDMTAYDPSSGDSVSTVKIGSGGSGYKVLEQQIRNGTSTSPSNSSDDFDYRYQDEPDDKSLVLPKKMIGQLPFKFIVPVVAVVFGVVGSIGFFGWIGGDDDSTEDVSVTDETDVVSEADSLLPEVLVQDPEAYEKRVQELTKIPANDVVLNVERSRALLEPTPFSTPKNVGVLGWEFIEIFDLGQTIPAKTSLGDTCNSKNGKWIGINFRVTNSTEDPIAIRGSRIVDSSQNAFESADISSMLDSCDFSKFADITNRIVEAADTSSVTILFDVPADLQNFLVELNDFQYPSEFEIHYLQFDISI